MYRKPPLFYLNYTSSKLKLIIQPLILYNQQEIMSLNAIYGPTTTAHIDWMAFIWGPGINTAIILAMYKYRIWWVLLHGLGGAFACLFTLSTAIPILSKTGLIPDNSPFLKYHPRLNYHYKIGITVLIIVSLQFLLGLIALIMQFSQAKSLRIVNIKKTHTIFGFLIIILIKSNFYININIDATFWGLLAQDIAFWIIIVVRKLIFPMMESRIHTTVSKEVRTVQSITELDRSKSYVVFANYAYDMAPLKYLHPGGFEVIESVKNREVDRYIYGMYSSQLLPEVPTHSHSFRAFSLLGSPVAKIVIQPVFSGFTQQEEEVSILSLQPIAQQSSSYLMKLVNRNTQFLYERYTDLRQLGQYYSLTLNNSVTRLYTAVTFLAKQNLSFLKKHIENISLDADLKIDQIRAMTSKQNLETDLNEEQEKQSYIPILFRRYAQGKLTDALASGKEKSLRLSCAKGEGLQFSRLKPGRVIMIAGGTGMNPFCDLIDLLFKEQLLKSVPELRREVHELSPVLAADPFKPFTFQLIAAFESLDDLHPITLRQIAFLLNCGRLVFTLKVKRGHQEQFKLIKGARLISSRFDEELQSQLKIGGISKVWICGPPKMSEGLASSLMKHGHSEELYHLL